MARPTAQQVLNLCPAGTIPTSRGSTTAIGTAVGIYLGAMYRLTHPPNWYLIVDQHIYYGDSHPSSLWALNTVDIPVRNALLKSEWTRSILATSKRTDILDADRNDVYELKPVRSREDGVTQLAEYLELLNTFAGTRPGPNGRPRVWKGGDWDPSPHTMYFGNAEAGEITIIHFWHDSDVQGLLLYDIISCERAPDAQDAEHILGIPVIDGWSPYLDAAKAPVQDMVLALMPKAPLGETFALIVPWRFFQAFILPKLELDADRRDKRLYEIRPNPIYVQRMFAVWAASQAFGGGWLSNALFVGSGWMDTEQFRTLYKAEMLAQVAGSAMVGLAAVPVAAAAVEATAVEGAVLSTGAAEVTSAAAMETTELAAGESLVVPSAADSAPVWINGAMPLIDPVIPAPPSIGIPLGPPLATPATFQPGIGMVGVFLIGLFGTTAEAAAAQAGDGPVASTPVGADGIHIVPVELLTSRSGKIGVHSKVEFGGSTFGVIGIVHPKAQP